VPVNPPLSLENIPSFNKVIHSSIYYRLIKLVGQDERHVVTTQLIHSLHSHALKAAFPSDTPTHFEQVFARLYLTAHFIRISLINLLTAPSEQPLLLFERQSARNMAQYIRINLNNLEKDFPPPDDSPQWEALAQSVVDLW